MTITWGSNTVHTFGTPSPGGAAAPTSLFGSTPAPSTPAPTSFGFGGSTSSPAPVGTSLFGGTPAPSSGTSLFGGTPAPSSGSSLFGGGSAPAAGTSLFGGGTPAAAGGSLFGGGTPAPASGSLFGGTPAGGSLFGGAPTGGSLFGSTPAPGSSLFGGTPGPAPNQNQIPAQAALIGFMDASARQEAERVRAKLEKLFLAYNGQETVDEDSPESAKFAGITYNPLTAEQRQIRYVAGGGQQQIFEPPRPLQICGREWKLAVVNNPDPDMYEPVPLIGASALQARVLCQQGEAKESAAQAKIVQGIIDCLRQRESQTRQDLVEKERRFAALKRRLLQVMTKVELARSMNKPFQPDEYQSSQRWRTLLAHVDELRNESLVLRDQARAHRQGQQQQHGNSALDGVSIPELNKVLKDHDDKLQRLIETVKKDRRDVELVGNRVVRM
ncbi:nucleoporin complex subunit 54 [Nitzschia inconspicua]|uniref:Nucleoporin complex subunit 54 n=1 Tax=Nitzschia inconspicua TaxID=303405 RepID=A0A9K3KPG1_9STRA|nr:nucleoporin complex subunit 54 [Nitzschia inconspicua]